MASPLFSFLNGIFGPKNSTEMILLMVFSWNATQNKPQSVDGNGIGVTPPLLII